MIADQIRSIIFWVALFVGFVVFIVVGIDKSNELQSLQNHVQDLKSEQRPVLILNAYQGAIIDIQVTDKDLIISGVTS